MYRINLLLAYQIVSVIQIFKLLNTDRNILFTECQALVKTYTNIITVDTLSKELVQQHDRRLRSDRLRSSSQASTQRQQQ